MRDHDLRDRALTLDYWRDLLLVLTLLVTGLVYGAGFLVPLSFALLVFVQPMTSTYKGNEREAKEEELFWRRMG